MTTPQLNEFLLHNPGIIEPDKLNWDYEDTNNLMMVVIVL